MGAGGHVFNRPEYVERGRTNAQYVADLYDVIFRRGPDQGGFKFWRGQVDNGFKTRDEVKVIFLGSAEWTDRLNQLVAAG